MKRSGAVFLFAICLASAGLSRAAEPPFLTQGEDGSTLAYNAAGALLWQYYRVDADSPASRSLTPPAAALSSAAPTWDPLTQLDSKPPSYLRAPIFDSLGNAWVVINDSVNLIAIQSNGVTGTWGSPHIIAPSLPCAIYTVGVAVDQAGGFYVTYGTGQPTSSTHPLMWTKYTPTGGWQSPALIYNSPYDFTETFPQIDSSGRLVVVFNGNGISSIASSPDQSSWGRVQTIAPLRRGPVLPSVAGNKSGTRLALVYLQYRKGLRFSIFNSATGQWDPETTVPESEKATFSSYSVENAFPLAVDEAENVTVVCTLTRGLQYTIGGFRYEGGQWTMKQLLPFSRSLPDPENFGSIALNQNGAVLVVVPTNGGGNVVNVSVFRYTPEQGWDTETAATYNESVTSRCKVAWFGTSGAVVVYNDFSVSPSPAVLRAALYSDGTWQGGPPIPGNFTNINAALATASSGEALLGMPNEGIFVTWLRP